ncbi:putative transcription factor homeobox-WOX family [Lupinus albus]|uniref:Putative transcription factor homeobox-WOX family n=1 Tax=Lupinus albus TaxID=3870 RepID=A0A6A4PSV3_LUPAL|nr:putative transcription factor homeobox-WOX family [Lupinus albus]
MKDTDKKLNIRGPRKCSHSKERTELKLDSSSRFDASITKGRVKKNRLKSKSHKHIVGTNTSRMEVNDSSIEGPIKDYSNKKLIIRQNLCKTDGKSSPLQSSMTLHGKKTSLCSRKEGEDIDQEAKIHKMKRRRKKKRQRDNVDLDDALRLQRRTRNLLIRMKQEQNLIDAYSGEGWKGQSREKIRPEKELQRAKKQILRCKLSIRDAIRQLDSLSSVGSIEGSVIAPDGSVYHEHIFCANCKLREAFPDNDIILCDGSCNRAFHQRCLDPPLDTENIPPEDQGWFCKFCECKIEILEATNAHLGTQFSLDSTWQDVFKEEAALPDGDNVLLNQEEELPSDDPDDDDYNPERREDNLSTNVEGTDDNASFDSSSSTSVWSLNSECSLVDEAVGREYCSVNRCIDSDDSGKITCGHRQRKAVDYKKLHDEMFGKDAPLFEQVSEDEDWGPGKRKRREKESDAANTLMTLHEIENKYSNNDSIREGSSYLHKKRPCFRIPHDAVEKLRHVFARNELPSRSVREALSKELGLDFVKVNKWFKNARYAALKTRKCQSEGEQLKSFTSKTSKDSKSQNVDKDELLRSKASKISTVHCQKNGKNVAGSEKIKSCCIPFQERRQENSNKIMSKNENGNKDKEVSDDVCLKKLLKERKRRINSKFEGDFHAAELEFERLSKVKNKVNSIKQRLIEVQNCRAKSSDESCSNESSVTYVPIAELREKF